MTIISHKKGYTLLLAVLTATMMLLIASFIVSVARKQFILSSAARDSSYAFYAADAGLECAVMNFDAGVFTPSNKISSNAINSITCDANGAYTAKRAQITYPPPYYDPVDPTINAATTTFVMRVGVAPGTQNMGCAVVKVGFSKIGSDVIYRLESRGYNLGWNSSNGTCDIYGPRKVERALRLTYQ